MADEYDGYQFKPGDRCNIEQYRILKRCSDRKDISEWNDWRDENPNEEIWLSGAVLRRAHLEGAVLNEAHLQGAVLTHAHLKGSDLRRTHLEGGDLRRAHLEAAKMWGVHLEGAQMWHAHLEGAELNGATTRAARFEMVSVNGGTTLAQCQIDRDTLFTGAALDNARVEPGLKQLLQYNIRRHRWIEWCAEHRLLGWPVRLFWELSDYGLSAKRIILWFFLFAIAFAAAFAIWPDCLELNRGGEIRGFGHALYFSIVTMTTLGFGDIHAAPDSPLGQVLLSVQVLLGYVMLGALVTRFAILFTGGGPAGQFYERKRAWRRLRQTIRVDAKLFRRWLRRRAAAKTANRAKRKDAARNG